MLYVPLLLFGITATRGFISETKEFEKVSRDIEQTLIIQGNLFEKLQNLMQEQQIRLNDDLRNVEYQKNEIEEALYSTEQQLIGVAKMITLIKELTVEWKNTEELLTNYMDDSTDYEDNLGQFRKICQDEYNLAEEVAKNLKCRYTDHGDNFLKIAPFKEEEVFLDPKIVIYHDVISRQEAETLKSLSSQKLKAGGSGAIEPTISEYRVAKIAWLDDEHHENIRNVNQRIKQMTNLNLETAEQLQVSYYESGGHYKPHYDFDINEENPFGGYEYGNRIATLMFYLIDVEEGGQTVFLKLNISITPKMGDAVFWYNLLSNGRGDYRTYHAACPVGKGTKWVANKWFSERGQEFRRPCLLE